MASIRLVTSDDAEAVRDIYAPIVRETSISFETEPPDTAEMQRRIAKIIPEYPWLVCDHEGALAGYAYARPHKSRPAYQWSVDVSVYVDRAHRRNGVGRALYTSLFELLTHQGFVNAFARIVLPNPASIELHESMDFDHVGVTEGAGYKRGDWHDVGLWHRRLRDRPDEPETPRSLDDVRGTSAWTDALSGGKNRGSS